MRSRLIRDTGETVTSVRLGIQHNRLDRLSRISIVDPQILLRCRDVAMSKQFLDKIDVTALLINALCKRFAKTVCRDFAIQACCDKRFFQHLVGGLSVHRHGAGFVSRRK